MSIYIMTHVWREERDVRGADLLVLLALADFADDTGGFCYPGRTTLAAKARVDERRVKRILKNLETQEKIRIYHNRGIRTSHGRTNLYQVLTPWTQGVSLEGVPMPSRLDNGGASVPPQGVAPVPPKPSVYPSEKTVPESAGALRGRWENVPRVERDLKPPGQEEALKEMEQVILAMTNGKSLSADQKRKLRERVRFLPLGKTEFVDMDSPNDLFESEPLYREYVTRVVPELVIGNHKRLTPGNVIDQARGYSWRNGFLVWKENHEKASSSSDGSALRGTVPSVGGVPGAEIIPDY